MPPTARSKAVVNCSDLFDYYRTVCAPSIARLEDFYKENPQYALFVDPGKDTAPCSDADGALVGVLSRYPEIHNEIRMAFTHLSRTALSFDQEDYEKLLNEANCPPADYLGLIRTAEGAPFGGGREVDVRKAYDHLQRAAMDAEKCLYLARMQKARDALSHYANYSVEELNNGAFFEKVGDIRVRASEAFEQAKIAEALGDHQLAKDRYEVADREASALEEYLDAEMPFLEQAKKDYLTSPKKLIPDVVVLGISILAAIALDYVSGGAL